jgi:hypothetical protein
MNYSQLQSRIAQWLNRTDMTAVIPTFISMTEEKLNRQLRVRAMEVALPETPIVDNKITLPANTADVKVLWPSTYPNTPLKAQALESVIGSGLGASPTMYAHTGDQLQFNGGGSVAGVLYQRIPAIATANTNWLSLSAPSVYLFGGMAEALMYMGGDPSIWSQRYVNVVDELIGNDQRYSGPLVVRAR